MISARRQLLRRRITSPFRVSVIQLPREDDGATRLSPRLVDMNHVKTGDEKLIIKPLMQMDDNFFPRLDRGNNRLRNASRDDDDVPMPAAPPLFEEDEQETTLSDLDERALLRSDPSSSEEGHFRVMLAAQTEVERVKFVVRAYLRTRMYKVNAISVPCRTVQLSLQTEVQQRLSENEVDHARR
ncbi:hypothetical protein OG21DRAFT_1589821 [Imleria badia]|nr:hypothetical protein OG21DRAFT_1589821 [Imleria badia]